MSGALIAAGVRITHGDRPAQCRVFWVVCLSVMSLDGGMELRHLRYFVAVAELLHFSRAAERLNLTQPALSRQIRDLEDKLGVALLQRHGTQITLTPVGARFLERAREILAAAERAADEARTAARQLRFGHYGTLWVDFYAPGLRAFAKRFPELVLAPVELTPVELVMALRSGEVDIALLGPVSEAVHEEFATRRLGTLAAQLAMGADNPLAKRRRYALDELSGADWIAWDERSFPGRSVLLRDAAKAAGFKPRIVDAVDSVASMFVGVATSRAIGYVLPMSRKLPHSGVVFAALKPPGIRFEMNIAWRRGAPRAAQLAILAGMLAAVKPSA